MYKILIPVFLLLFPLVSISQRIIVAHTKASHFTYIGIDNLFSCIVEGKSCKSIELFTDNGSLTKYDCDYVFRPARQGQTTITVKEKEKNKLKNIGEFQVYVNSLPPPVASLGGYISPGYIIKAALAAQSGLGCKFVSESRCLVDSFMITIIRNSAIVFQIQNKGNAFTEEVKDILYSLKKEDHIIFSGIIGRTAEAASHLLPPLEFIIKE